MPTTHQYLEIQDIRQLLEDRTMSHTLQGCPQQILVCSDFVYLLFFHSFNYCLRDK